MVRESTMPVSRRILFVAPYVPSLLRPRAFHFVRHLAARGHRVTVVALVLSRRERELGERLRRECDRVELIGIPRLRSWWSCARGLAADAPLQALYCAAPRVSTLVRRLVATGDGDGRRFDLVHVEHLRAAGYGLAVAPVAKVYDAVDCHTRLLRAAAQLASSRGERLRARIDLGRTLEYERRLLAAYGCVVVTSQADRTALANLGDGGTRPTTVHVVPNGVDADYFQPSERPRDPATLVFTGRLRYHANVRALHLLLDEVMPRVWSERPETRLSIVGEDPPRWVRTLAARHPNRLEVTGYVPDVRPWLARAMVSVAPLVYAVGIQNKILEAMAMALPVVATPAASVAIGADARSLLVAEDATGFAAAVLSLLSDEALRRRMGAAARKCVERDHRWESAVARLADLHEEEIARSAAARDAGHVDRRFAAGGGPCAIR